MQLKSILQLYGVLFYVIMILWFVVFLYQNVMAAWGISPLWYSLSSLQSFHKAGTFQNVRCILLIQWWTKPVVAVLSNFLKLLNFVFIIFIAGSLWLNTSNISSTTFFVSPAFFLERNKSWGEVQQRIYINDQNSMEGGGHKADKTEFTECWRTSWQRPYIMRLALSAGIGGLLFGYDTGNTRLSNSLFNFRLKVTRC